MTAAVALLAVAAYLDLLPLGSLPWPQASSHSSHFSHSPHSLCPHANEPSWGGRRAMLLHADPWLCGPQADPPSSTSSSEVGEASSSSWAASLAGLSLAYALPLVSVLEGLLTSSAAAETEMVATERVLQMLEAPQEHPVVPVGNHGGFVQGLCPRALVMSVGNHGLGSGSLPRNTSGAGGQPWGLGSGSLPV